MADPATSAEPMAERIGMANAAATLCLVMAVLFQAACLFCLPHADARDYLGWRLDIPREVQSLWPAQDGPAGASVAGVAPLASDWPPCFAFLFIDFWAMGLAVYAAIRKNWVLFFAAQVLLVIPGELFGSQSPELASGAAILSAGIVVARGVMARRFRLAMAAGAVAILGFGVHTLAEGRLLATNSTAAVWNLSPEATRRISTAMAGATPAQRPAADYVLAQLAYIGHDWTTARALAPRLRPDGFSHGAYTAKRVVVLRAFAAGRTQLAPLWASPVFSGLAVTAIGLTLVFALVGWRLRRRAVRIGRLTEQLTSLRPVRGAV